jgi:hypothetical protein
VIHVSRGIAVFFGLILPLSCQAAAAEAPSQLYGKTVVVTYTFSFMLRPFGSQQQFHPSSSQHTLYIYVSSAGRLFVRDSATSRRGSGSFDVVGSGQTPGGGASKAEFQGNSLIVASATKNTAAAAQIRADFDSGFASCTAKVIVGKSAGVDTYRLKSLSTGQVLEVQSRTASEAGCSIKSGNVFAE